MELKKTLTMPKGKFPMRANLPQKEPLLVQHWQSIHLYEKLREKNAGKRPFYLHDGPPYANNEIHAGHALNKILKDMIIRYHNLIGNDVPYTPGWDCHGLPIELCVTKSGVDRRVTPPAEFRRKCREYALGQVDRQRKQMLSLGLVGDYEHPYLTLDPVYESHQLEIFRDMALSGLIYKGLKPVNWSPSSESALAEAEIEYKDVTAKTIYVRFPIKDGHGILPSEASFVIWTTTPWTLPANLAICVNPRLTYGLYRTDKGLFVLLKDLADPLMMKLSFSRMEEVKTFLGQELEGVVCKHPFYDRDSIVITDEYVTSDSGTGCVHIAPGHGEDDYRVGKRYNLPPLCPVDERGYMTKEAGPELQGLFYEECNDKVLEILMRNGSLLKEEDIVHSYPHDWRTKKPTIFRATKQWFCSIDRIKDKLVEEAKRVEFLPSWGKARLVNMLSNRDDWCISRQRLWGVPIPIFYGEDGEPLLDKALFDHVIELVREHGSDIWYEWGVKDLMPEGYHSPHSPNGTFTKEKDIMDVWFDSGSSFLGSGIALGHPFPADLYLEGNDQYRGWYNSSMILAVATHGERPYKAIVTHGFLVDQNGEKFSKSKKNGIDPETICKNFGADILRLWATTIDYSTAEIKLSNELLKIVSEEYRKIRNTFKFLLSNLLDDDEGHAFDPHYVPSKLSEVESLLLNRLKEVLLEMKSGYESYNFSKSCNALTNFMINDLSSFALDFGKDILYCDKKDSQERRSFQYVLYTIAKSLAIALSPILPFTTEEIYDTLDIPERKESIALEDYPELGLPEKELSEDYQLLLELRSHVNSLLEPLRKDGEIGSSSEAMVLYRPESDKERKLIEKIGEKDMQTILIVSSFQVSDKSLAKHHEGKRCDRCWNYFDELEEVDGAHLCPRCKQAIEGADK